LQALLIPANGYPEILTNDIDSLVHSVFGVNEVAISAFDFKFFYYHIITHSYNLYPLNYLATSLKRVYTNDYSSLSAIYGDVLVYSSIYEPTFNMLNAHHTLFIEQVLSFYINHKYVTQTNKTPSYL
jgi:hypothetical protein